MIEFNLKPADRPDDDDASTAPVQVRVETVQPRGVRSQLATIDARLLEHQDGLEALLPFLRDLEGRRLWRRLHGDIEETHQRLTRARQTVERGG